MIDGNFRAFVRSDVVGKFRFAAMAIKRSASAAGDDHIHSILICSGILIMLDPMFKEMFVPNEQRRRVIFAEHWHVVGAKPCGSRFNIRSSVRSGGVGRM